VWEEFHHSTWYICNTCVSLMNKGLEASVPCTIILFWKGNKERISRFDNEMKSLCVYLSNHKHITRSYKQEGRFLIDREIQVQAFFDIFIKKCALCSWNLLLYYLLSALNCFFQRTLIIQFCNMFGQASYKLSIRKAGRKFSRVWISLYQIKKCESIDFAFLIRQQKRNYLAWNQSFIGFCP